MGAWARLRTRSCTRGAPPSDPTTSPPCGSCGYCLPCRHGRRDWGCSVPIYFYPRASHVGATAPLRAPAHAPPGLVSVCIARAQHARAQLGHHVLHLRHLSHQLDCAAVSVLNIAWQKDRRDIDESQSNTPTQTKGDGALTTLGVPPPPLARSVASALRQGWPADAECAMHNHHVQLHICWA